MGITDEQIKNKLKLAISEAADQALVETAGESIAFTVGFNSCATWIQEQQNKWISVKDRFPDVGVFVLVHRIEGYISVDQYRQLHGEIKSFIYNVTHWMPLPKLPTS